MLRSIGLAFGLSVAAVGLIVGVVVLLMLADFYVGKLGLLGVAFALMWTIFAALLYADHRS